MKTASVDKKHLIIAITGASGAIYGLTLLKMLKDHSNIETHLTVSSAAQKTLLHEMNLESDRITPLADHCYDVNDIGATIASGSFKSIGMVIAPCSMRTLAAIANGFCDNLITRAADVTLKERRRLVLMTRESPLNLAHIRNMASVTEMGGIVCPPVPTFYNHPKTIDDLVNQTVKRVLQLFNLDRGQAFQWTGIQS